MEAKRAERVLRERKAAERAAEVLASEALPTNLDLRPGPFQEVLADGGPSTAAQPRTRWRWTGRGTSTSLTLRTNVCAR
jgi:hypothetical protein